MYIGIVYFLSFQCIIKLYNLYYVLLKILFKNNTTLSCINNGSYYIYK